MAKRQTKKPKARLHRTLYGEPTQFVAVRLPESTVAAIEKIVATSDGKYRDRTDFIRNAVMFATVVGTAEPEQLLSEAGLLGQFEEETPGRSDVTENTYQHENDEGYEKATHANIFTRIMSKGGRKADTQTVKAGIAKLSRKKLHNK